MQSELAYLGSTEIDEALLPTDTEVAAFRSRGYYTTRKIFSDAEIDLALVAVARFYAGKVDNPIDIAMPDRVNWKPGAPGAVRINNYIVLQAEAVRLLACKPIVGAIAAKLLGSDGVRIWNSSLLCKQSNDNEGTTKIGWHADAAYWRSCASEKMLTGWIPLQDTTCDMGTLQVIEGSNCWQQKEGAEQLQLSKELFEDVDRANRLIAKLSADAKIVSLEMARGQMSFHHRMAVHGSGPNISNNDRIAIMVGYQDIENEYRSALDEHGQPFRHESDLACRRLPDGRPDYADPSIFLPVWTKHFPTD